MSILYLLKQSLSALRLEDETYLAYVYGQKIEQHDYIRTRECKWPGLFFRCLLFFRLLQKNYQKSINKPSGEDCLVYAGTENQFKSLSSTIKALTNKGKTVSVYHEKDISCNGVKRIANVVSVHFGIKEIIVAVILFSIKAPWLYVRLKKQKNDVGIRNYFDIFCQSYIYIPYFISQLYTVKPAFVVISNDHNLSNRSLRISAYILGIKTVFMQHGAGTIMQPPLDFDYAFLNGEQAMKAYTNKIHTNEMQNTTIFLSGQKKQLIANRNEHIKNGVCIGIGVSTLNEFIYVKKLLDKLTKKRIRCFVRTHPGQSSEFLDALDQYIKTHVNVIFSDPRKISVSEFFSQCSFLVAANTSLHLDAGLAGISSYYYEFSEKAIQDDYFGFEKAGLIDNLPENIAEMNEVELNALSIQTDRRLKAIHYFSESFNTSWEGREGELVAVTLNRLLVNKSIIDIYNKDADSNKFSTVYRLNVS